MVSKFSSRPVLEDLTTEFCGYPRVNVSPWAPANTTLFWYELWQLLIGPVHGRHRKSASRRVQTPEYHRDKCQMNRELGLYPVPPSGTADINYPPFPAELVLSPIRTDVMPYSYARKAVVRIKGFSEGLFVALAYADRNHTCSKALELLYVNCKEAWNRFYTR